MKNYTEKKPNAKFKSLKKIFCCVLCSSLLLGTVPINAFAVNETVIINSVKPLPNIRKADGRQETIASIKNNGANLNAWAKVKVGNDQAYIVSVGEIKNGTADIMIPVTDTNSILSPGEKTALKIELFDNADCNGSALAEYTTTTWERTRHWEFYLSQSMHTDIGYTNYQENLKLRFSEYLDMAIDYVKKSENRATDIEKYKYNIESSFMLGEAYLKNRNADQISELLKLIKAGKISVGAGKFNYTMENFSAEETARASYYTNRTLLDMLEDQGIKHSKTEWMFDNPSFTKSYVDVAASADIKYGIHSMNSDRSPYNQKKMHDIFYMEGMNPENKMLIFNGRHYNENYGLGGPHAGHGGGSADNANNALRTLISDLEARSGRVAYPYDKYLLALVPFGDNLGPTEEQIINANALNKKWDEQGYSYPRIKSEFPDKFFEAIEQEYQDLIPVEKGTEENWWNDGWGTTAHESGVNKQAGNRIPVAETMSSFASVFAGKKYPYEDIRDAVQRNLTYDEHTWGNSSYDNSWQYINQFEWKRSNALGASAIADKVISDSMKSLSSTVTTQGKAIFVYNPTNWKRSDVVTIKDISTLPDNFEIKDGENSLPYTIESGVLNFVAPDVPALGYKTVNIVEKATTPEFSPAITTTENTIENSFYKVTFSNDGTIASILDKQNENRELVDKSANEKFNQYRYYDDHSIPFSNMNTPFTPYKWTKYSPTDTNGLKITSNGMGATATLDTSTFRASSIVQKVTLYKDIPRIDIDNEVVKSPLPRLQAKEEAFYTFPFKASSDYEISYDLPLGNTKEGEQVYGTSTDWYTVNKWINVKDKKDNYNMIVATPNTGLAQFGERRTGNWSFDYKSSKPYIYSYVMNNMWQTNFQGDQPGYVKFKYSISSNISKSVDKTSRFGWEISMPFEATLIDAAQTPVENNPMEKSLLEVNKNNVQLTTMKTAEANSDGMILRFHEISGNATENVQVTLPFAATSIIETDVIENDRNPLTSGTGFSFDIPAYGVKTFRIRFGSETDKVTGFSAVTQNDSNINLSKTATATAESYYNNEYMPDNAKEIGTSAEWASKGQKNSWYRLDWDSPVTVGSLSIADRINTMDNIQSVKITFSDNSYIDVTDISNIGETKTVVLDAPKTTNFIKVEITGTSTAENIGLKGFEVYPLGYAENSVNGTKLNWNLIPNAISYEIFRSDKSDFTPGTGNYLTTVSNSNYFDAQVSNEVKQTYYYKVRAVFVGTKGVASDVVSPTKAAIADTLAPLAPVIHTLVRSKNNIDLHWTPVIDDTKIHHYEIYRNGKLLVQTNDDYAVSYRDRNLTPETTYEYTVKAVDQSGNISDSSNISVAKTYANEIALENVTASKGTISPKFHSDIYEYELNLGNDAALYKDIRIVATAFDKNATLTVNGNVVQSSSSTQFESVAIGDKVTIKVESGLKSKSYTITMSNKSSIIQASNATAGSEYGPEQTVMNLINGSGMAGGCVPDAKQDNNKDSVTMWHSKQNPREKAWVVIDCGKNFYLDQMYIWNMNQLNAIDRGFKNVKIEYSKDNKNWTMLLPPKGMTFSGSEPNYPFQFAQASGEDGISATNLNDGKNTPVSFNGAEARYVKITANPVVGNGSWGSDYYGMSAVCFTYNNGASAKRRELLEEIRKASELNKKDYKSIAWETFTLKLDEIIVISTNHSLNDDDMTNAIADLQKAFEDLNNPIPDAGNVKATPGSGAVNIGDKITLSSTNSKDTIKYSVDGVEWLEYVGPITITKLPTKIKAYTTQSGFENGVQAEFLYTLPFPKSIKIKNTPASYMKSGEKRILRAEISPNNAVNKAITWKTGDSKIATINKKTGEIKAVGAGKVLIIATATNGVKKTVYITVKSKVTKVYFKKRLLSLKRKAKYKALNNIKSYNPKEAFRLKTKLSWFSNYKYAEINKDTGLIKINEKAKKSKVVTVTVKSGKNILGSFKIMVK